MRDRFLRWMRPAVFLGHNGVTLAGAVLTTSSAIILIGFWIVDLFQGRRIPPYAGIILFLVLPGIFVAGLALMPAGVWMRRRSLAARGKLPDVYPKIDLRQPVLRRALVLVVVLSGVNALLLGAATYRGVEYMDSTQFCGQTCHTVMQPEFRAYQASPHARVACVDCHIGSGAPWFVRAKISGVRQVFAVTLKTYSRPIPSPVENLRPARETCEQCHWPQKFGGEKLVVRTHFAEDEKNSRKVSVLLLKIGGRRANGSSGIHGHHIDARERIDYVSTDRRRQVIPVVRVTGTDGKTAEYASSEVKATPEQLAAGEHRAMDCMDCHNRPTHIFQLPATAVDEAMAAGAISPDLPFVKKQAVAALKKEYASHSVAAEEIARTLTEFYRAQYPATYQAHRALVESAVESVQGIYERNIFTAMKIGWGTYPNNIGHEDFLGCFRCHDGNHSTKDGRAITQDCDACHTVLAQEEENPKILTDLGIGGVK